jgi:hypothetical protein
MKKMAMLAGVLALGLGACNQNAGLNIGQGFGMDANVSGASVTVAITTTKNAAGAVTGVSTLSTVKQPTVVFNARPQSVGFQITSYTVQALDQAGAPYQGLYQRSASGIVAPGYVCSTIDPNNAAPPLDQCAPQFKTASNVPTPINGLVLIVDRVAEQIAADCAAGQCPTLKLKITFNGVDDAGHSQSLVVAGADLSSSVTSAK